MDDRNPETPGRDNETELDRLDEETVNENLEESGLLPLPEATPADGGAPAA
ncbi:hypothetical protein [Naasia sp. SYSU D00948]|uniref:hypothetical protein n=1 Tax=Naasia sp. SYSU D00948 TaxID=2817379 RepID=UPI001B3033F6|nr:hypothetical protein [Naasia sp. SYSU D00948]